MVIALNTASYQVSPQLRGTSSGGICLDSQACPQWKRGTPGPPWRSRWPSPPSGSAQLSHAWEPKQEPARDEKACSVVSTVTWWELMKDEQMLNKFPSGVSPQLIRLQCFKEGKRWNFKQARCPSALLNKKKKGRKKGRNSSISSILLTVSSLNSWDWNHQNQSDHYVWPSAKWNRG